MAINFTEIKPNEAYVLYWLIQQVSESPPVDSFFFLIVEFWRNSSNSL